MDPKPGPNDQKKDPLQGSGAPGSDRSKHKIARRMCIDPFPVWEDGFVRGKGYLNLMDRGSVRLNLNIVIYSNGRYPYFKKNRIEAAYTVRIPLPVIELLQAEILKKGVRVRRDERHKWKVRRFRAGGS